MLKARPNLNGLTAWSLVSQFNLKPPTAAKVLEIERLRRERAP